MSVLSQPRRDLAITAAASLVCLAVAVIPLWGPLQVVAVAALVLFLPGYAVAAAMFPADSLGRGERLVYSLALSIATAGLGGLVWQLAFDLGRVAWVVVIVATTLVACLLAQRRRVAHSSLFAERVARPARPGLPTAAALLGAAVLAGAAIHTATEGVHSQRAASHFSALWVVPGPLPGKSVEVAVENHRGTVHLYRLDVAVEGRTVRRWRGKLGSRQEKSLVLSGAQLPAAARLVASLYVDGAMYRRVEFAIGTDN